MVSWSQHSVCKPVKVAHSDWGACSFFVLRYCKHAKLPSFCISLSNCGLKTLFIKCCISNPKVWWSQCGYAFYWAGQLRRHLKTHSGEKLNKCNQCDYASSYASTLRRQLKTHDGENSQQMHQEKHYISSSANTLKIHWKALEEKLTKALGRKVQFHNLLTFFVEKCGQFLRTAITWTKRPIEEFFQKL